MYYIYTHIYMYIYIDIYFIENKNSFQELFSFKI